MGVNQRKARLVPLHGWLLHENVMGVPPARRLPARLIRVKHAARGPENEIIMRRRQGGTHYDIRRRVGLPGIT